VSTARARYNTRSAHLPPKDVYALHPTCQHAPRRLKSIAKNHRKADKIPESWPAFGAVHRITWLAHGQSHQSLMACMNSPQPAFIKWCNHQTCPETVAPHPRKDQRSGPSASKASRIRRTLVARLQPPKHSPPAASSSALQVESKRLIVRSGAVQGRHNGRYARVIALATLRQKDQRGNSR